MALSPKRGANDGFATKNLLDMPIEKQQQAIESYCNEHPLDSYMSAVEELYVALPSNKNTRTDDNN